ncbi:ER lumen protein-retaining receptor-like isoform X2 [Mytilus californianus]|uniref:ER lumen protein-retaining receptor-like isoform X2 n=1 Tax=Mytilus californianus TaxID=6549 RepID=UPI0022472703|nr:ER lumen protein-retaining receptor-like isoform X2 [Mytilus californianus]
MVNIIGNLNSFGFCGDMLHVVAILILLRYIWKSQSVNGISGKSLILFALVYTTRYLDLFSVISVYNTILKVIYIITSYVTLYLIYIKFRYTYDRSNDTFRAEILMVSSSVLALFVNYELSLSEFCWTFSIYLESVAMLPQFFMIIKNGEVERMIGYYLFAMGSYRALHIMNWMYRYKIEGFYNAIAANSGLLQSILYIIFLILYSMLQKMPNYFHLVRNQQNNRHSPELKGGQTLLPQPSRWPGISIKV